jgi:two-component SAPR family response regulator
MLAGNSVFEEFIESTKREYTQLINGLTEIVDKLSNAREALNYIESGPQPETSSVQHSITQSRDFELSIFTLGRFYIECGRKKIPSNLSRRSESLLKFLLLHPNKRLDNDLIIESLVLSSSKKSGLNTLRVTVHELRKTLSKLGTANDNKPLIELIREQSSYRLSLHENVWIDYVEFEKGCSSYSKITSNRDIVASFAGSLELYNGDLFEENRYDDWAHIPRERLVDTYLNTLWFTAKAYYETGDHFSCIGACRKLLEKDILNENGYELIVKSYTNLGSHSAALRWIQICQENLSKELNIQPNEAIRSLERAIINRSATKGQGIVN